MADNEADRLASVFANLLGIPGTQKTVRWFWGSVGVIETPEGGSLFLVGPGEGNPAGGDWKAYTRPQVLSGLCEWYIAQYYGTSLSHSDSVGRGDAQPSSDAAVGEGISYGSA